MPEQPSPRNLVGPRVRTLRVRAGLSQETLAAKLQLAGWDLSRGGLSKVEARLRRVSDAELWILKGVLSCEVADLFPGRVQKVELGQVLER